MSLPWRQAVQVEHTGLKRQAINAGKNVTIASSEGDYSVKSPIPHMFACRWKKVFWAY
jgi:hypothetical protein